ncbi:MAG: glycosyltransferase [Verrucomicrobia bacterium]|nr:glycosyltransferase [Verrucomicrobiota bacterium]
MSGLPKISVVTPTFNCVHTVRETIESVRSQDYPNWEHLVMDGGSTDGTLDILREYPHLNWVSEKDEGHYHAMNKGVLKATGDVVNILNADDCYRPGVLRQVAEAFAAHPDWDGLFGDIIYVDGAGREIYRREEAKFDYAVLLYSGVCYVIHQTLFVKRSLHDRHGYYRHKDLKNTCDLDFILRIGKAGAKIGHVREYLINYRYHQHGQSADKRITANMRREDLLVRGALGAPTGWRGKVLRFIYRAKRQAQKLVHRGKIDLVPGTWKLRKHMQEKTEFSSNIGLDKL